MQEKSRPVPYPVRLPEDLRAQLEEAARAGARSLHSEIISRLQQSFEASRALEQLAFESGFQEATLKEQVSELEVKSAKMVPLFSQAEAMKRYHDQMMEVLAKRDEKIREWWQKEFGYDPEAPKVERPQNKGPEPKPAAAPLPPAPTKRRINTTRRVQRKP